MTIRVTTSRTTTSQRRSRALASAIAGLLGAGLLACVGPVRTPTMAYYTLAIPGSPAQPPVGPVQLGEFSAEAPYTRARLVYRTSPVRIEYYTFHRWVGSPPSVVSAALREYLRRAATAGQGQPIEINGHIQRIEELDESGQRLGELEIDFSVLRDGSLWLERSYAESEPASAANPEATVMALSRALGRAIDRLLADLAGVERDARKSRQVP